MVHQMPLAAGHLNKGLFSDYYLDEIVPTLPEWQFDNHDVISRARALREELRGLLRSLQPEALDEAQLEEQWVKPVLERLGHHWSVQVKMRYRERGFRKPDYVLTASADDARALTNRIYDAAELAHTLAVADAKKWGVQFDQASASERNPSQQIDEYLRYSELPWGLLTDGRVWRLYHRDSSKSNDYYAVDLPALLTSQAGRADENFLYFYLFFRREAFDKGGWLESVLQGSVDYAESVSERLEDEVYEALRQIAQGFLRYRRNRLSADAAMLRTIYEQSLVLLYRLLFILYAESRGVLLLDSDEQYGGVNSLTHIKKLAAQKKEFHDRDLEREVDFTQFYTMLSDLFFIVDSGSSELGVPPYNGRLFSEETYPFLAQKAVGDKFLVEALDRLTRVPDRSKPRERVFVDYRDLDVRHLGAIYEKLLEYQLDVATQALTVKDGRYTAAGAGDRIEVQAGEVYLRTGSNERKITGSYYTPDYIVRFIVERTLEPLLSEITQRHASLDADGHWVVRDRAALRRHLLDLNVLDPATGSGHFMVEAVAYIAEWLRRLELRPDDMAAGEDELIYWKRQVVTSCIYGVDVNPLAVELAKLSLWLTTIARGRPLSFLDHHVKLGNTLVGARAAHIGPAFPLASALEQGAGGEVQLALFADSAFIGSVSGAVDKMSAIEHTIAAAVSDVKDQEKTFAALNEELKRWRRLADAWAARHFGLDLTAEQWRALYDGVLHGPPAPEASALLERAAALAAEHRFFHWDLEFPEVFYGADGQPLAAAGFDAVIGNPPYVRQERIQPYKPYFAAHYEVHSGTADLFLYFYEQALKLVKPARRVGYITSGTFMNSNSAAEFRRYLNQNASFKTVIDFGAVQPFKGVDLATNAVISILQKGKHGSTFRTLLVEGRRPPSSLAEALNREGFDSPAYLTENPEWRFQSIQSLEIANKMLSRHQTLKNAIRGEIYRGVTTGLNEAFVIESDVREKLIREHPSSVDIIKVLRRGQDLRPWYQMDSGLYLIFTRRGIDLDQYPAIKRHLEQYQSQLEPEPSNWESKRQGKWPGRKPGSYAWYEIQDQTAYFEEFEKAKILWPDIARFPRFSRNEGYYLGNTAFMIPSASFSLLALMQSRAMWFAISQIATPLNIRLGLWRYRVIQQFVERLPIPDLSAEQESALAALAEEITGLARGRYQLHEGLRRRVRDDLGAGQKLNTALENWWELDFSTFRAEVKKAFKNDVPLAERDDWEKYLRDHAARHQAATDQIIALETRLNALVYEAFRLTPDEIALIEKATKYPYGAV